MPLTIGVQRLTAVDLYHMIDWLRDGWNDDEHKVAKRLQRLEWHLEELPEPWRTQASEQYAVLVRGRIVANVPWQSALVSLSSIVAAWDRSRPAVKVCGIGGCRISYRSPEAMLQHRVLVHDYAP